MQDIGQSSVYHIYLRSFKDSNGDGIGDISGVTESLDYLKELGVSYLWLTPFYKSPQKDNGYDVADYRSVDPSYGTIEDFETLVREAEARGLGIMLDMVFNHSSTEHEWFQKAMAGDENYKDYYIWKDPKADGSAPTNWVSKFGGPAWEYAPKYKQYYLHLFDRTQADLNWENPNVREELKNVLRFWMKKGVKGFRFDVINLISKPEEYEDDEIGDGRRFYSDGPKVHEYLKELCADINAAGLITVGEMSSTSMAACVRYSNPAEEELSMCFNFHHLKVDYANQKKWELKPFDFTELKKLLNDWQLGMQDGGGWNALFWSNHDQPRILSRFGDDKNYPKESAKMLAAALYLLRGTPYIYQGEEIGMTNAYFGDINRYRDVESINYHNILLKEGKAEAEIMEILRERSRDNSRTPMQWNAEENGGFTKGRPWLSVNPNYKTINAGDEAEDEGSVLGFYKKLLRMRKEMEIVAHGTYKPLLEEHGSVFAYIREYENEKMIVLANFYGEGARVRLEWIEREAATGEGAQAGNGFSCLLWNYAEREFEREIELRPYEVLVYYTA